MALQEEAYLTVLETLMSRARDDIEIKDDPPFLRDVMIFLTSRIPQPERGEGFNTWEEIVDWIIDFYA